MNFIEHSVCHNFPIHLFLRIWIMMPFRNCPPEDGGRAGILNLPIWITVFNFFSYKIPPKFTLYPKTSRSKKVGY